MTTSQHMQNDEQLFGFIDASIRKACAQTASQEEPWAGNGLELYVHTSTSLREQNVKFASIP